ncbi:MAG TPA: hypothetical protein VGN64_01655 [Dyadobacter sp.]|jgi:hypothetical protein|nr:hypothetical protein [Dyadobacter sp.]
MHRNQKATDGLAAAGPSDRVWHDPQLRSVHICLYAAIAYHCTLSAVGFIQISRKTLMRSARIKSIATYHVCIRQLRELGYIDYRPSYHPLRASRIALAGKDDQELNRTKHG